LTLLSRGGRPLPWPIIIGRPAVVGTVDLVAHRQALRPEHGNRRLELASVINSIWSQCRHAKTSPLVKSEIVQVVVCGTQADGSKTIGPQAAHKTVQQRCSYPLVTLESVHRLYGQNTDLRRPSLSRNTWTTLLNKSRRLESRRRRRLPMQGIAQNDFKSGLGPSPHQPDFWNWCQRHTEQPEPRHLPCLSRVNQK